MKGDKVAVLYSALVNNKKLKAEGEKLLNIEDELVHIFCKFSNITDVVREKGFSRHAATTQKLFKVVGVSDLVAHKWGFGCVAELSPPTVKLAVTGNGRAEKAQVQEAVRKYLTPECADMKFESDDVSDAVAVGIAYLLKQGVKLKGEQ